MLPHATVWCSVTGMETTTAHPSNIQTHPPATEMWHGEPIHDGEATIVSANKLNAMVTQHARTFTESPEYFFAALGAQALVRLHAFVAVSKALDTETQRDRDVWAIAEALVATELVSRLLLTDPEAAF